MPGSWSVVVKRSRCPESELYVRPLIVEAANGRDPGMIAPSTIPTPYFPPDNPPSSIGRSRQPLASREARDEENRDRQCPSWITRPKPALPGDTIPRFTINDGGQNLSTPSRRSSVLVVGREVGPPRIWSRKLAITEIDRFLRSCQKTGRKHGIHADPARLYARLPSSAETAKDLGNAIRALQMA